MNIECSLRCCTYTLAFIHPSIILSNIIRHWVLAIVSKHLNIADSKKCVKQAENKIQSNSSIFTSYSTDQTHINTRVNPN